jgi:hypothetical protein
MLHGCSPRCRDTLGLPFPPSLSLSCSTFFAGPVSRHTSVTAMRWDGSPLDGKAAHTPAPSLANMAGRRRHARRRAPAAVMGPACARAPRRPAAPARAALGAGRANIHSWLSALWLPQACSVGWNTRWMRTFAFRCLAIRKAKATRHTAMAGGDWSTCKAALHSKGAGGSQRGALRTTLPRARPRQRRACITRPAPAAAAGRHQGPSRAAPPGSRLPRRARPPSRSAARSRRAG